MLGGSESITTRVQTGTNVAATGSPAKALKRWMIPAVGAALVVLIGGGWAWRNAHPSAVVASAAVPVPLPAASEKSVAVLPFVDMSEKHDQEYFSDGLTEELIDLLARTPELRVPARTSSYFFKGKQATVAEIAKALNVAHVLEGSVRKSGRVLRITVQLIHVQDDHHLWSETYDRNLKDIFKVQDEIAGSVARALKAVIVTGTLTGGSSVIGSEAYDLYLQGLASERRHSRVGFRSAINFYRSAVQIEPKYALAWAQLSELYGDDAGDTGATPAIAYARAREAANRALLLNPLLAEAHDAMGEIHKNYDWNWPAAKAEFRRALEVDPTNQAALLAYGSFARMMGLRNEAIRVFEQAVNRDPLNASAQVELGWADWVDGRLGEAESRYRKGLNLAPEAVALHAFLGLIMVESGQSERALSEIQREPDEGIRMYALAIASFAAGRKSESDRLLAEFTHKYGTLPGWQVSIAQIHAERGEFDDAFRWLGRGYEQRDAGVAGLLDYPFLRKLNGDPRYKELLHTLKLPDT